MPSHLSGWRWAISLVCVWVGLWPPAESTPAAQIRALRVLYDATNGGAWHHNGGWNESASDPCSDAWYGVSCYLNYVISLELSSNNLTGTLPKELQNLPFLFILLLGYNHISGTVPAELGNLPNLEYLYLNNNYMSGTVPKELGNLLYLKRLIMGYNQLSGTVPKELGNLINLKYLYLNSNNLGGTLPKELGNLKNLELLVLISNHFSGSLPKELGALQNLWLLDLNDNNLSGTLPKELGNLTNLYYLQVDLNNLSGSLPKELGNLTNLRGIDLSNNKLSGTLPKELGNLTHLLGLYLYSNHHLSGTLPKELGYLTNLTNLDLSRNNFSGTLPEELPPNLAALYLFSNNFTGEVPETIFNPNLQAINLSSNTFWGKIPEVNCPELLYLDLSLNQFSGTIPQTVGSLKYLKFLFLYSNALIGSVPSNLFAQNNNSIRGIFLQNNKLRGNLSFLAAQIFPSLQNVDLSNNALTGAIPELIFSNPRILTLALTRNCFDSVLTDAVCKATSLNVLALDGLASASFCQKRVGIALLGADSQSYLLPSSFHAKDLPDCIWTSLPNLTTLHLSGNNLKGRLPNAWPRSLEDLTVSHNRFKGYLNQSRVLQKTDVSRNLISGTLPVQIHVNENATAFNCSLNRISGDVPRWLQSFSLSDSIRILSGNVMACKSTDPTVKMDADYKEYVCSSDDLTTALYVWVSVFGLITLFVLFRFATRYFSDLYSPRLQHYCGLRYCILSVVALWNELPSSTRPPDGVNLLLYFMRQTCFSCAIVAVYCVVLVLPILVFMNKRYSTYTFQYAWAISVAFLSGSTAGVVVTVLWIGSAAMILWRKVNTWTKCTERSSDLPNSPKEGWILSIAVTILLVIVDVSLMIVVNALFVRIYTDNFYNLQISHEIKLLAQFVLGTIKTTCNVLVSLAINAMSNHGSRVVSDARRCVLLATALLLFNNVIAPALVSATTDSQCFLYLFQAPNEINTEYKVSGGTFHQFIAGKDLSVSVSELKFSTAFTPPFVYSHQCRSALIRNYVPVYFYSILVSGIVRPSVLLIASRYELSSLHWTVSKALVTTLPGFLWPNKTPSTKQSLFPAIAIVSAFANYVAVLLIFGFACPPLSACVTLAVCCETLTWRWCIKRFHRVTGSLLALNQACEGVSRGFEGITYMILGTWAVVSTLLVSDMVVTPDDGWLVALWVPCVLICTALTFGWLVWMNKARSRDPPGSEMDEGDAELVYYPRRVAVGSQDSQFSQGGDHNEEKETSDSHEQEDDQFDKMIQHLRELEYDLLQSRSRTKQQIENLSMKDL